MPDLIPLLRNIVGDANVLIGGDLAAYEQDWRRRAHGKALAVVRPSDTEQVSAIVRACAMHNTSIVPQGGNTGLVAGGVPDRTGSQIVLHLGRLSAIRSFDKDNLTVTVEAGCLLQNLQEAVQREGYMFPLSLAAQGSCTIGGNLATNAGGTQVVRYGNTRDLCLGLEVVTAEGEIWHGLRGLRKDNTGYDLRDLMIGSEGTLGIITAATMKVYQMPDERVVAWLAVPSMAAAVALLGFAHGKLGAGLTGFEVMNRFAISLVRKHMPTLAIPLGNDESCPYTVLIECSVSGGAPQARENFLALMEAAFDQGIALDGVLAENISQSNKLWQIRESIPMAQSAEGANVGHDISIRISRIPDFVRKAEAMLIRGGAGARLASFGHLGDGNLHFNLQAPEGANGIAFFDENGEILSMSIYNLVAEFGGSISAEHGIGKRKASILPQYQSPVALKMMAAIKRALDPKGILNPDCIIPRSFLLG